MYRESGGSVVQSHKECNVMNFVVPAELFVNVCAGIIKVYAGQF